jgi:hypothetical protein
MELSSRSIVAGTSRLVSALAVSFLIGLGLSFGEELAALFDPFVRVAPGATTPPILACVAISQWFVLRSVDFLCFDFFFRLRRWLFLSFPLVTLCFFVLLDGWFLLIGGFVVEVFDFCFVSSVQSMVCLFLSILHCVLGVFWFGVHSTECWRANASCICCRGFVRFVV